MYIRMCFNTTAQTEGNNIMIVATLFVPYIHMYIHVRTYALEFDSANICYILECGIKAKEKQVSADYVTMCNAAACIC